MQNFIKLAFLTLLLLSSTVRADAQMDNVVENLKKILPAGMNIQSIEASPMEGVYVVNAGTQSMYVFSRDGYIMVGDVYDADRKVSLGEERKAAAMSESLANIPESDLILMGEAKPRYVTVFTDTDCGYCQKFHKSVAELQKRGMQVRYLMFPRAGLQSPSYKEAVSVWCAEDQARAMTIAKSGGTVEPKECENPVAAHYQLGQQLGVRGTPTMILDNGKVITGYLTPNQLFAEAGELN